MIEHSPELALKLDIYPICLDTPCRPQLITQSIQIIESIQRKQTCSPNLNHVPLQHQPIVPSVTFHSFNGCFHLFIRNKKFHLDTLIHIRCPINISSIIKVPQKSLNVITFFENQILISWLDFHRPSILHQSPFPRTITRMTTNRNVTRNRNVLQQILVQAKLIRLLLKRVKLHPLPLQTSQFTLPDFPHKNRFFIL